MNCYMCSIYRTATIRTKTDRYCTVVHRSVTDAEDTCGRFDPYHIAWCPKNGYQIDLICCLDRQEREVEECRNCRTGDKVKHIKRLMKSQNKEFPIFKYPSVGEAVPSISEEENEDTNKITPIQAETKPTPRNRNKEVIPIPEEEPTKKSPRNR